jgi:pyrimidine oxygenase
MARKKLELGVFLPIENNGFMISETAPQYSPGFEMNRQIAILAERFGFDFVFSMSKWRGFGGNTHFWDETLESVTLMTALAAVTSRIGIIATMQPLLFPPAVAAKMAATIDNVSKGRFGINIVSGSFLDEYEQMGMLPPGYSENRYRYAEEWLHVVKRLWTEPSVTFDGEWFHLRDCRSSPEPIQKPYPFLICAGTSDEGFRFTAKEGDYSFIGGTDIEHTKQLSVRMKDIASEYGRSIKTAKTILPVIGATLADAQKKWKVFQDGVDKDAIANIVGYYGTKNRQSGQNRILKMERDISFAGRIVMGSPADIAEHVQRLVEEGGIDSVQLLFADYIEGLETFHAEVIRFSNNAR